MAKILIVEDEVSIADGLVYNLKKKNHDVDHVADGEIALHQALKVHYDLIVLDVSLPKRDGFDVCQSLRRKKIYTPILMLTARDQADDIVHGLKSGADDYLTKPFDLAEFLARTESLLRRCEWSENTTDAKVSESPWHFGPYWVDFASWQAQTREGLVTLNKKEAAILKIFRDHPGTVVSRQDLLEKVWELPNHPNARVVDNIILKLRKYFEKDTLNPEYIVNVRGVGFKFIQ